MNGCSTPCCQSILHTACFLHPLLCFFDLRGLQRLLVQGSIFGATFSLEAIGAADLAEDTLIPGIAVYSRRAEAVAAWTSGVVRHIDSRLPPSTAPIDLSSKTQCAGLPD